MLTLPDQAASQARLDELRLRHARLEQDIDELRPRYERALRNRRGAGLAAAGARMMRLAAAADALAREIRRLEG